MNALDTEISFFNRHFDTGNPINGGTFLQIVMSEKLVKKYGPLVDRIRALPTKEERKLLKDKLPGFTPSGLFWKRTTDGLIKHSGLLSFDLDAAANPFLNTGTAEAVKAQICKLPEVAFCQISASGTGVWGVIPMAYPERHEEQFEALETAFAKKGYVIDPACSDITRLRYWSYDPAQYINPNAILFAGLPKRTPEPPRPSFAREHLAGPLPDDLPAQAAAYLVKNRVPLECTYANFMRIAFACKYAWGDAGKDTALDILHTCTTFAQSNTARKFETLWRNIRRENGNTTTAGTLVHLAKEHGFKYAPHSAPPPRTPPATTPAPMPAPRTEPPTGPHTATKAPAPSLSTVYERRTFTDRLTGESFDVLLNADGYPAAWDLEPKQREALADTLAINPIVTDAIAQMGLILEAVEPMTEEDNAAYLRMMERHRTDQKNTRLSVETT